MPADPATETRSIFARHALLPGGWAENVRIDVNEDGTIGAVATGQHLRRSDAARIVLPAPGNLHSHSFQRAMAGMTERRAAGRDSFWTWRELMYRFLDVLTPDQLEAVAAFTFMEMLEAGYAAVGEFHYVHHQPGGAPYDALAETSERMMAAAGATGIGLTHLPVLYTYGGAGKQDLKGGQLRFGCDPERFEALFTAARSTLERSLPADARIGIAPHSLRATEPDALKAIFAAHPADPVHMHAAEQTLEVEEVEAWLGARPIDWIASNLPLDQRWCLIHSTHMTEAETLALAGSGAVAGLCPITESNLGDGIFNAEAYLDADGHIGIGSDSNIRIALSEELRTLEYSQRLRDRARNVLAGDPKGPAEGATGQRLYASALAGSARALDRHAGAIETGRLADLVAIDGDAIALAALTPHQFIDGWVFAGDDRLVTDVWAAGRHCVENGQHKDHAAITARYRAAVESLVARI